MTDIILDTNFLIYAAKQKIDYPEEISRAVSQKGNLIVFSTVVSELVSLAEKSKKGKDKESAFLALKLLETYIKLKKIKIVNTEKIADEAILDLAEKKKVIVATSDRALKEKLKGKAKILNIRQKKKLELSF